MKTRSNRIEQARTSLEQLAVDAGVSYATVRRWLDEEPNWKSRTVHKIEEALILRENKVSPILSQMSNTA